MQEAFFLTVLALDHIMQWRQEKILDVKQKCLTNKMVCSMMLQVT